MDGKMILHSSFGTGGTGGTSGGGLLTVKYVRVLRTLKYLILSPQVDSS